MPLREADVSDLAWHKPAPALSRTRAFAFVGPVTEPLCAVAFLGFISSRIKGKGKVFGVGDRRRMFLAQTPGLYSEELVLPESVGEEQMQSFSQTRIKGSGQMVLMGVRTRRVALLSRGNEQLV